MTTSPAPAKPTFTPDARGNYPCPDCNKAFTRPQGVSRHWGQQHATTDPDPEPSDDGLMDDLRTMWADIQAEKNRQDQDDDEPDDLTGATLYVDEDEDEPAVQLLEPADVLRRTTCTRCTDTDNLQALADAVVGLIDAITRLVNVGYDRGDAVTIAIDLIDRLHGRPAA